MCIVFFEWTANRFVVCHNRDEMLSRKTTTTTWWKEGNLEILAPRDSRSGGTWFGFEKTTGKCAFLTNIRQMETKVYTKSRGELVLQYLKSTYDSAIDFLTHCSPEWNSEYAGFNLIVFSGQDLAYYSNRFPEQQGPMSLSMGSYGLSNSLMHQPFVKVSKGLTIFRQILANTDEMEALMREFGRLMRMEEQYVYQLPDTGYSEAFERNSSSIWVPILDDYGTRTTIRFILEWEQQFRQQ